jgi:hypothetical protein
MGWPDGRNVWLRGSSLSVAAPATVANTANTEDTTGIDLVQSKHSSIEISPGFLIQAHVSERWCAGLHFSIMLHFKSCFGFFFLELLSTNLDCRAF